MAEAPTKINIVSELAKLLKVGESFIVEQVIRVPSYPDIPEEISRVKVVKTSDGTVRVDKWE